MCHLFIRVTFYSASKLLSHVLCLVLYSEILTFQRTSQKKGLLFQRSSLNCKLKLFLLCITQCNYDLCCGGELKAVASEAMRLGKRLVLVSIHGQVTVRWDLIHEKPIVFQTYSFPYRLSRRDPSLT